MKKIILLLNSCLDCPFMITKKDIKIYPGGEIDELYHELHKCNHPEMGGKIISTNLPEWCPLEDEVTK